MDPEIKTLEEVADVLRDEGAEILTCESDVLLVTYEGIPVSLSLTDEESPRLRFSVDIERLENIDEDTVDALQFRLLDLNTEIDPVATAIDSTDPENLMIQARTTLRMVSIIRDELVAEFMGLINSLAMISHAMKEEVPA